MNFKNTIEDLNSNREDDKEKAHGEAILEHYDRREPVKKELYKDMPEEYEKERAESTNKDIKIYQQELEIKKLKEENKRIGEDLEYVNYALEDKIQEARYDAVTGLESRKTFFTRMDSAIKSVLNIPKDKTLSNEEWFNIVNDKKNKEICKNLHVTFGDVSYLSVANRGGRHAEGDAMLLNTAKATNNVMPNSARLSGDEFATIIVGSPQDVADKISKVRIQVAEQETVSNLKANNLTANIDIGVASFSEALDVYKKLLDKGYERRGEPMDIERDLKNIWMYIADKRSSIDKIRDRISLLLDRRKKGERFLGELTKSIYGMEAKEIEELMVLIEESDDQPGTIEAFIKNKEISLMNEAEGEYNKAQVKEVLSLLGIL